MALKSAACKARNHCHRPSAEEDIIWLVYPCHVCTLAWPPHCCVSGKKVALWCAKWFTDRRDINKLFIQDSQAGSPSESFKRQALKKQAPEVDFSPVIVFFPRYVGQGATDGTGTFTSCRGSCRENFQWRSGGARLRDKGEGGAKERCCFISSTLFPWCWTSGDGWGGKVKNWAFFV